MRPRRDRRVTIRWPRQGRALLRRRSVRVQRERVRLDLLDLEVAMTRSGGGARAALALAAAYRGERVVAIGFGGIRVVRDGAVSRLVRNALALLEPWAEQGRLELRCLRPS